MSCDTSTLHPSKCKWYVGSHRCLGRWQAPVSLAPSSKVQNHKWWNATKHCLQGHFSSIFPTLRVPESNELEISKNCSSIFRLRSSASLASLFFTWKDTELSRTWVAGPIQQNHHFPGRFSQSTLANHQRFERPPNAEGKCQLRLKNLPKKIKTSYRDDTNFEDTTVTCVLCINQDLKTITVSSLVQGSHQNHCAGTGIPHMQGKSDDASCGIAASDLSIRNQCGMWGSNRYGCGNADMEMDTTYRCTYKSKHIVAGV